MNKLKSYMVVAKDKFETAKTNIKNYKVTATTALIGFGLIPYVILSILKFSLRLWLFNELLALVLIEFLMVGLIVGLAKQIGWIQECKKNDPDVRGGFDFKDDEKAWGEK